VGEGFENCHATEKEKKALWIQSITLYPCIIGHCCFHNVHSAFYLNFCQKGKEAKNHLPHLVPTSLVILLDGIIHYGQTFFFSNLSQGNIWSRYHLPIIGFLNHYIEHSTIIRRKSFLYNRGDYNSYRQKLSTIDWHSMYILVMISTPLHVVKDKQLLT
jgi:hypothetical protein